MRFWQLFLRNLKETYRDPLALGFLLIFPLIFMVIFGWAFGGSDVPSYTLAVVDTDQSPASETFITHALPQVPIFQVNSLDSAGDALTQLKQGDIRAFIVIPSGFGAAVEANRAGTATNIPLNVTYDESDIAISSEIISALNTALRAFANIQIPIAIDAHPINIEREITQMDFLAPGIIIFGLLIMIPTSARIMTRDKEKGYLARLLTTPTHPWEFITGYTLCLLLIAVVQIIFFILLGWLFGMDIVGSLALAFLVFVLTALASIGIGMIVAALSKSENQAEPLTWLFAMPLAMLSGVWFSLSFMPRSFQTVGNLFPFAHAVEAARAILLRGAGLAAVQSDIIFIAAWAVGAILFGIFLFGRTMRT
jgi:ABC-2 type transport system permease protein